MINLNNGKHKVLFSGGKLYLDGVQIAGEGIVPSKDVCFDFQINRPEEVVENKEQEDHPAILEVNVFDEIPAGDIGPGQK